MRNRKALHLHRHLFVDAFTLMQAQHQEAVLREALRHFCIEISLQYPINLEYVDYGTKIRFSQTTPIRLQPQKVKMVWHNA
jgi:hypothetical protein